MTATTFVELCRKDLSGGGDNCRMCLDPVTGSDYAFNGHAAAINELIELADEHFVIFPSSVAIPSVNPSPSVFFSINIALDSRINSARYNAG